MIIYKLIYSNRIIQVQLRLIRLRIRKCDVNRGLRASPAVVMLRKIIILSLGEII